MSNGSEHNSSDLLRLKADSLRRIEAGFQQAFNLARECVEIANVIANTEIEFRIAGMEVFQANDDPTWQRTRSWVVGGLNETREQCERFQRDVEPSGRVFEIQRFLDLAIMACGRCTGPVEGDQNFRCKVLEYLATLDKSRQ